MESIKVIVKSPNCGGEFREIKNDLEEIQKIVGGYVEMISLPGGICILCNEDGRLRKMNFNCNLFGYDFVGPIVIAGVRGDGFSSCPFTYSQVEKMSRNYLW